MTCLSGICLALSPGAISLCLWVRFCGIYVRGICVCGICACGIYGIIFVGFMGFVSVGFVFVGFVFVGLGTFKIRSIMPFSRAKSGVP